MFCNRFFKCFHVFFASVLNACFKCFVYLQKHVATFLLDVSKVDRVLLLGTHLSQLLGRHRADADVDVRAGKQRGHERRSGGVGPTWERKIE
jgi:hypothetical protein